MIEEQDKYGQTETYRRQHTTSDGKYCLEPILKKGEKAAPLHDNDPGMGSIILIIFAFGLVIEFIARVIL